MSDIKLLIVEDEPLIAEDIAQWLEKNEFLVSAIVYSKEDAMEQLITNLPDMVLLDINLNGEMSGIEIAEKINTVYNIPFIFITSYSDKQTLEKAKYTEPSGYIVKPFNEAGLYSTLEIALYNHAQKNKRKFPALSLNKINNHLSDHITEREFSLLQLIYDGKTNKQIADALFISTNTVKKHINNTYLKLGACSRATSITSLRELMLL
ncbi:MAG: response regulator transcription factor [Ferruginibacter sp.]|nr:response regulator transcription factor [Ferruginibacter sp.]